MRGFPGQVTNTGDAFSSVSMVLNHSSAPFGVVMVSDGDGLCRLPDKDNILKKGASADKAIGVLIKQDGDGMPCNPPLVAPIGEGESVYANQGQAVSLMRVGAIFVKTETAVTVDDEVFYRIKGGTLGAIRNDADTDKAVKLNGAVFMHSADANEVVEINLNLNTVQESY